MQGAPEALVTCGIKIQEEEEGACGREREREVMTSMPLMDYMVRYAFL